MQRSHRQKAPDIDDIGGALDRLVATLRDDADPLLWLLYGRPASVYVYRRAVGSAVLCGLFGIAMGFDRQAIFDLTLGGLLLDIGKAAIPMPILVQTRPLNAAELEYVRRHASDGYDAARLSRAIPGRVLDMIRAHHERMDGSGYPRRLRGTEIPLFARIAAIVDTYDALTLDRGYAAAMSQHAAIEYMRGQRDAKFDAAMVAEFRTALGRYPTGTWVVMETGHHGVVFSQGNDRGRASRVYRVYAPDGQTMDQPDLIDRKAGNTVVRALHPGTHRLAPGQADQVLAAAAPA